MQSFAGGINASRLMMTTTTTLPSSKVTAAAVAAKYLSLILSPPVRRSNFADTTKFATGSAKVLLARNKRYALDYQQPKSVVGFLLNNRLLLNCKHTPIDNTPHQPIAKRTLIQYSKRSMSTMQSQGSSRDNVQQVEDNSSILSDFRTNKTLAIRACGRLYEELTATRPILYAGAPHEGIQFRVQYFDSQAALRNVKSGSPMPAATVCLLHGAPGHYKDFDSLIEHLTKRNIRVIAPNFPDYSVTFKHSFRHSPRERLEFLLEFFKSIGVNRFDMMIAHSSAVYTMFELLEYTNKNCTCEIKIKSMGLFSTSSHRLSDNMAVTPFRLFTLKLFDYTLLRPIMMVLTKALAKMMGIRNRVDMNKVENLLIAACAVGFSEHEKLLDRLNLLRKFRIPVLLVYGTRDKLIPYDIFKQLEYDLGIKREAQVKVYAADGSLASGPNELNELVEVSRFESGGHYAFQKYPRQVNEDVYQFLVRHLAIGGEKEGGGDGGDQVKTKL